MNGKVWPGRPFPLWEWSRDKDLSSLLQTASNASHPSRRALHALSPVARFLCIRYAKHFARNGTSGFLPFRMREKAFAMLNDLDSRVLVERSDPSMGAEDAFGQ